jgi:hypothetical protein
VDKPADRRQKKGKGKGKRTAKSKSPILSEVEDDVFAEGYQPCPPTPRAVEFTEPATPSRSQRLRTPSHRLTDPNNIASQILFTPRSIHRQQSPTPGPSRHPGWPSTPGLNRRVAFDISPSASLLSSGDSRPSFRSGELSHGDRQSLSPRGASPAHSTSSSESSSQTSSGHSPAASGPAGNRRRFAARDVWTFYDHEGSRYFCTFCKYVSVYRIHQILTL